jgi:hypothetical protein
MGAILLFCPGHHTRRMILIRLNISRPLTHEQRRVEDGLMQFVIKDKDMFSVSNTFMGEAYLRFSQVPDTPAPITSLPQQLLPLSRPNDLGNY